MRLPARAHLLAILLVVLTLPIVPAAQQQQAPQAGFDLTGEWGMRQHEDQPERGPGPELGDYLGLPINEAGRRKADSWDASILTLPEHQCKPHPSTYALRGPQNLRIWKDVDPQTQRVIAISTHGSWMSPVRTIWLDGRPHPPDYAAHTFMGFSTGTWEGDVLVVTTTHIKQGWIRRNGIAHSDQATMIEHYIRHGNFLTVVTMVTDPAYFTEPFYRSSNWEWAPNQNIGPYPCGPQQIIVEVERPQGTVPHNLPGTNTAFLQEFADKHKLPFEATRGGAETTYPEYQLKLKELMAK